MKNSHTISVNLNFTRAVEMHCLIRVRVEYQQIYSISPVPILKYIYYSFDR